MGWTFAVWAPSLDGGWIDLTGSDPLCAAAAGFDGLKNLRWPRRKVVRWVKEELEWSKADAPINAILEVEPLSREIARAFAPKTKLPEAIKAAVVRGYPLALDVAAKKG